MPQASTNGTPALLGCLALVVIGGLFFLSRSCSSGSTEPAGVSSETSTIPDPEPAPPSAPPLRKADRDRVCRAAIAGMNGHSPSIVRVVSSSNDITRVRYSRPSDGKVWTNECRIDGDRVIWRTVDAFGSGSGQGRWRTHPLDESLTYAVDGRRVSITTTFPGEPASTKTYTVQ